VRERLHENAIERALIEELAHGDAVKRDPSGETQVGRTCDLL
jgi:hypothetical protein